MNRRRCGATPPSPRAPSGRPEGSARHRLRGGGSTPSSWPPLYRQSPAGGPDLVAFLTAASRFLTARWRASASQFLGARSRGARDMLAGRGILPRSLRGEGNHRHRDLPLPRHRAPGRVRVIDGHALAHPHDRTAAASSRAHGRRSSGVDSHPRRRAGRHRGGLRPHHADPGHVAARPLAPGPALHPAIRAVLARVRRPRRHRHRRRGAVPDRGQGVRHPARARAAGPTASP